MKGKTTCKVCGMEFSLIAEEHYIAQDSEKLGVFARLTDNNIGKQYDAFDCPHCGCQNIMQERKSLWMPELENDDVKSEESEEKTDSEKETVKSVDDMRKFLIDFCSSRYCTRCPLNVRGYLCGRGFSFRSTTPGNFGYMSDEQIKRHYDVVKEVE